MKNALVSGYYNQIKNTALKMFWYLLVEEIFPYQNYLYLYSIAFAIYQIRIFEQFCLKSLCFNPKFVKNGKQHYF